MKILAEFTVEGEPASKSRARFTKRGSKTVTYTPEKTKQAEERMAWVYRASKGPQHDGDTTRAYGVEATFYYSHNQRRDVDNMLKLILDGLNGVAWPDDVQVVEVAGRKQWVAKSEARTEVRIHDLGTIYRPTKKCLNCQTDYPTYPSTTSRGQKFCSQPCAHAYRSAQRKRECEQCGKAFQMEKTTDSTRFCSIPCAARHKSVEVTCIECGTVFHKPRCFAKTKSHFCTDECRMAYRRARRAKNAKGACADCGGPTSKKTYTRCLACSYAHRKATA